MTPELRRPEAARLDFSSRDFANRAAAELRNPAADISRANQIDRFMRGRDGVGATADVRQGLRADLRPSWRTAERGDLGRIDRNLDVAMRNSGRGDIARGDRSDRGDSVRGDSVRGDLATSAWDRHPKGADRWADWGNHVKDHWHGDRYHSHFNNRFWAFHNVFFPWGYGYYWHGFQPWWYWWNFPTWSSCLGWFPGWGWNAPYYYDYGVGGNVVYYGDGVYVNDQPVGTAAEYAQSAADLATVDRADIDLQAGGEWLPLGTFALTANQNDTNPRRVIQLAVDKQGIVSGTMYDEVTDKTFPIQGRVDKQTQRVAFTIGDNPDVVMETGLYNLTQEQTPVLIHKGKNETATNLLIRLKQPDQEQTPPAAPRGVER